MLFIYYFQWVSHKELGDIFKFFVNLKANPDSVAQTYVLQIEAEKNIVLKSFSIFK